MYSDKNTKEKILKEIESLSENEQQAILGLVENYIHSKADETGWNQIPKPWQSRIEESLKQADEGKFVLHEDAIAYIRKKFGLND